jgi:hypothetical protein
MAKRWCRLVALDAIVRPVGCMRINLPHVKKSDTVATLDELVEGSEFDTARREAE